MSLPSLKLSVENLHNKNQFVIEFTTGGSRWLCFQSYTSECALYNASKKVLYLNRNCWLSKTTSKHLYLFINEYTNLSCHNCKELQTLINEEEIKTYSR